MSAAPTTTAAPRASVDPPAGAAWFLLTLWTDDPLVAAAADAAGVDRVGVDLERRGKRARQHGLGTWISDHSVTRLPEIRRALVNARLFARVNPLSRASQREVEQLLGLGVEVLMLPMFSSAEEVACFSALVDGRAAVVPLLETLAAAADVAALADVAGLQEVHVGINDLALALGLANRFQVLDGELIERVAADAAAAGLRLGVGGIGRVRDGSLPIPSDLVYAQYPRLGATAALLSRAYMQGAGDPAALAAAVARSRARLARWFQATPRELERARLALRAALRDCRGW